MLAIGGTYSGRENGIEKMKGREIGLLGPCRPF